MNERVFIEGRIGRRAFSSVVLASFGVVIFGKDKTLKMRPCTTRLPNHILEFSVPDEVARGMSPRQINSFFDTSEPFEKGFRSVTSSLYDFNGPFWVGALGSL